MKKLLPIILIIVGLGAGIGAGVFLKPAPPPEEEGAEAKAEAAAECDPAYDPDCEGDLAGQAMLAEIPVEYVDPEAVFEYVKMPKQFVVPIIKRERVTALVVVSVSIETPEGTSPLVLEKQPKLRDGFLQVLFAHANSGGFDGAFTTGQSMRDLRGSLREAARRIVGEDIHSVLIEEIVKQPM